MTLKELREQSGKSVKEVADALKVTDSAIRHYEDGIREINIRQVIVLSELFDVSEREVIDAQLEISQTQ